MAFSSLILTLILLNSFADAADYDVNLARSLKIEANHNLNRLKSFDDEVRDNKIYEDEREKGLGEYLEEQEKWDLQRERGLRDYRRQKLAEREAEQTPAYRQHVQKTRAEEVEYEKDRVIYINTRNRVRAGTAELINKLEVRELGLDADRPRFDVSRRSRNKWVNRSRAGGGRGAPALGNDNYNPPANNIQEGVPPLAPASDFPPLSTEFPAAPAPMDNFDDSIPAPIYDGGSAEALPYDSNNYSPDMAIPPPPPPEFDF